MPTTRRETDAKISKNQLRQDVEVLIKQINANSEYDIEIVPEETNHPWFEISIEYPPYSDGLPKFQRRISLREAENIVWNIFHIIKDYHDYEYEPNFGLVKPRDEGQQFSDEQQRDHLQRSPNTDDIPLHKKVHVRMLFAK